MKNFKKLFFVLMLVCVMLLPNVVNAAGTQSKLVLNCDGGAVYDEKEEGVSCSVSLEIPTDENVAFKSISFKLDKSYVGEEAIFEKASDDIVVTGDFENGFVVTKKDNKTFTKNESLVVFENIIMPGIDKATYEKNEYKYTMKVNNIKAVVDDKTSFNLDEAKATLRLLSIDNTLSSLTIDGAALEGFNSKATLYKYTTSNGTITLAAKASNQNATIAVDTFNAVKKEVKNRELQLPYGDTNITVTVTSESGVAKVYTIYAFRYYRLFPGYSFEFNSKNSTYKLNVGKEVEKFAICYYDESKNAFVKKDNVLCLNTGVLEDVFGINPSSNGSATYYKTLKLNGTYVTADYASLSSKEVFDRMEIVTGTEGNQTLYTILGDVKDGENTLTFSVDELHPEYKVTINKGEASDALAGGTTSDENVGIGGGNDESANKPSDNNNATGGIGGGNDTVQDSTVESPKTGIVTYTAIILAIAGIAGGVYYYLRKKNIIKKI